MECVLTARNLHQVAVQGEGRQLQRIATAKTAGEVAPRGGELNGLRGADLRRWCYPSQDLLVKGAIAGYGETVAA